MVFLGENALFPLPTEETTPTLHNLDGERLLINLPKQVVSQTRRCLFFGTMPLFRSHRSKDNPATKATNDTSMKANGSENVIPPRKISPSPPTHSPTIEDRISMLQMAQLDHTGTKPHSSAVKLTMPPLPDKLFMTRKSVKQAKTPRRRFQFD